MKKKINWKKVWTEFGEWICRLEDATHKCPECKHQEPYFPEWSEQQEKIQELVDAQI